LTGASAIEFVTIEDNTLRFGFAQENVEEFWNDPSPAARPNVTRFQRQ
jgi:hypothetical protein